MRAGGGRWVTTTVFDAPVDRLAIAVESTTSPFHRVSGEGLDFVIRPVYVPALIAAGQSFDLRRRAAVVTTYEEARAPLRMFLRNIFRKRDFRPMQGQAIFNVLRQNDSGRAAADRRRQKYHLPTRRAPDAWRNAGGRSHNRVD